MRKCVHCGAPIVLTTDRGWVHQGRRLRLGIRQCRLEGNPQVPDEITYATPEPDL